MIVPCGHGGICFECCQKIINGVVNSEVEENQQTTTIPFYLVGKNFDIKIYNIRCHLCRNIGLKVFQLDNEATSVLAVTPDAPEKANSLS